MKPPEIQLAGVWKSFSGVQVLQGIDLEIAPGETFTLLGGSGAGKSVTLRIMIGLLRVDSGRVLVQGRDVTELSEREWVPLRARFGMVFQGSALFDSLSVFENIAYPLREHESLSEEDIRKRVGHRLALVGLSDVDAKLPAQLSGGMRKRVAIARAIVRDPEIILYDEPTTGLDPGNARRIAELILQLQEQLGLTSVVVTHDLALCAAVSNRIGVLADGRLAQIGPLQQICQHPSAALGEFLGAAGAWSAGGVLGERAHDD